MHARACLPLRGVCVCLCASFSVCASFSPCLLVVCVSSFSVCVLLLDLLLPVRGVCVCVCVLLLASLTRASMCVLLLAPLRGVCVCVCVLLLVYKQATFTGQTGLIYSTIILFAAFVCVCVLLVVME